MKLLTPITHTVRLWQHFRHPPTHHPQFARTTDVPFVFPLLRPGSAALWALLPIIFLLLCAIISFPVRVLTGSALLRVVMAAGSFIVVIGTTAAITGTAPGVLWSTQIAAALARQRANCLQDLLAVTPDGGVVAMWALALGIVHNSGALQQLYDREPIKLTPRIVMWTIGILGTMLLFEQGRALLFPVFVSGAILGALYLDHLQSMIVAVMVGVATGMRATTDTNARVLALVDFLAAQLIVYGAAVFVIVVMFPALGLPRWWGYGLPQLVLFYLCREGVIAVLWHYLRSQRLTPSKNPHAPDAVFPTVARATKPE